MKRTTRRLLAVAIGLSLSVALLLPQGSAQATSIGGLGTAVINSGAAACSSALVNAYIVSPTQVGPVGFTASGGGAPNIFTATTTRPTTGLQGGFDALALPLPVFSQSGSAFLDTLLVFVNTGAACTLSIQVRNAAGTSLLNTCGVTIPAGATATPTSVTKSILTDC